MQLGCLLGGHQADPSVSDDPNRLFVCAHRFALPRFGFFFGIFTFAERASPTIWSLVSTRSKLFAIQ